MKQLLFYKKPVAINKKTHANTLVKPPGSDFSFAQKTSFVALAGHEFAHAAKEYAIVFAKAGGGQGQIAPVVLLGLRSKENLLVDEDGRWRGRYIPGFVRQYPFLLGRGIDSTTKMAVCVDSDYKGFDAQEGERLFNDDGEYAAYLKQSVDQLQTAQGQFTRTGTFAEKLKSLDLLVEITARSGFTGDKPFTMKGLYMVDEKRLVALKDKQALELFRTGEMGWIYSHLISISNMRRLVDLLAVRVASA
ncbi:MAG: SapC family protein [Magnetococcales bacterium]|nr:SapC family protein [Magnetococcales bacterium]